MQRETLDRGNTLVSQICRNEIRKSHLDRCRSVCAVSWTRNEATMLIELLQFISSTKLTRVLDLIGDSLDAEDKALNKELEEL